MADIFLSYSQDDRERVESLVQALEAEGWAVFWDRELAAGAPLRRALVAKLQAAGCVVVAWSEASIDSDWVIGEAELGKKRGVLVPVSIDDAEPPLDFRALLTAPLASWDGSPADAGYRQLVAGVREMLGSSGGDTPTEVQPLPPALEALEAALGDEDATIDLPPATLREAAAHRPSTLHEYFLTRIATWAEPRHRLDRRFVRLTLMVDQGEDAPGERWAKRSEYDDLGKLLDEEPDAALVLLGAPGSGKSTLLRRLELDRAAAAMRAAGDDAAGPKATVPVFFSLNAYRAADDTDAPPAPDAWLADRWRTRYPALEPFETLLADGRVLLLLDGLNEVPHAGEDDYRERIERWRRFLAGDAFLAAGNRAVVTCRTLDYSHVLSSAALRVPQVQVERLSPEQVRAFLVAYSEHGEALWAELEASAQLDLFRSPLYLRMLAEHGEAGVPSGRAALFARFVRSAAAREVERENPRFTSGTLLTSRDRQRLLAPGRWTPAWALPAGSLFEGLSALAHAMQTTHASSDGSQVRIAYDRALAATDAGDESEAVLGAGADLDLVEDDRPADEVLFVHQLLQEFFAARRFAEQPDWEAARSAWRAGAVRPSLEEIRATLAPADPLPAAPGTGWEETVAMAASMVGPADAFVEALAEVNLPLAGRCAAQVDVDVSEAMGASLGTALVARSRDPEADLRARIAAGRALGELGDPRLARGEGPDGAYLLPPFVTILAGRYPIGSDEGLDEDKAPAHEVTLEAFAIARLPVTNAEWRCFMAAGGYTDERWWQETAAGRAWFGGATAEGPRQGVRDGLVWLKQDPSRLRAVVDEGRMDEDDAETWGRLLDMAQDELEAWLESEYPDEKVTAPLLWKDERFNHPAHPVVGVCWHEARAYCVWLAAQSGMAVRLPSEAEWEVAARGREGRRFAPGPDLDPEQANTLETHVRGTTPVGVFPRGDTPDGLADMAGNVWEWTSSAYRPYPYDAADGREDPDEAASRRVLRGGSWRYAQGDARAAFRARNVAGSRGGLLGFRVVLSSPIS